MFKKIWAKFANHADDRLQQNINILPDLNEQGLLYQFSKLKVEDYWNQCAYLEQLVEEDLALELSDAWLVTWDSYYCLLEDEEHALSYQLLMAPQLSKLTPNLSSKGSLAQEDFSVYIKSWCDGSGKIFDSLERLGPVLSMNHGQELVQKNVWNLIQAIKEFSRSQRESPGELTNQTGWASIRKLAKKTQANLDGFLEKTVVIKPDRLKLNPVKSMVDTSPVIELRPSFEDQPKNWLDNFDAYQEVQDRYRVLGDDGSVTHVLVEPKVQEVLQKVKQLPGRRISGSDGVNFLRNPFAAIGDAADSVLDPDEHVQGLQDAGIYFHRFKIEPVMKDGLIESMQLWLEPVAAPDRPVQQMSLCNTNEFATFLQELEVKIAAGLPAGLWNGYELELGDFNEEKLKSLRELHRLWIKQEAGIDFDQVLDLSAYGERVIGIGEGEKISSPFLIKDKSENWLPDDFLGNNLDSLPALPEALDWNEKQFEELDFEVDRAIAAGDQEVHLSFMSEPIPLEHAKELKKIFAKKIKDQSVEDSSEDKEVKKRAVLNIELNIDEATYQVQRSAALNAAHQAVLETPSILKSDVDLRDHQQKGVAWMQHLFKLSPEHVSGALLADDMGLGKTIQLLTFVTWFLESTEASQPVLIVAPVSLLDNWERELQRFFITDNLKVLKLYGNALAELKYKKNEIPDEIKSRGISNLLKATWLSDYKIVLTTYETLRDQEFSLARKKWGIMICDEAQKIKNPAALITQAAKAIPARFKIACTGTPVENTLIDLWSLFDFIQPGLLGSLNGFGKNYQRPIESHEVRDERALMGLKAMIEPQTLRRTKQDVAKDLPNKFEDLFCRNLVMYPLQRNIYVSAISEYKQKKEMHDQLGSRDNAILTLLQKLKMLCAHPYSIHPSVELKDNSPKMCWLLNKLDEIKNSRSGDKVIIFTELREVQREVQHAIEMRFGFKPIIINGDTSTSSQSANSRQKLIDRFQQEDGFSVIILSTVAVGFGVNVQAANHVIHFTRCWNPAKEDQATDRAYRIGQEKDVYVYYPTLRDALMPTFESTLDDLLSKRRALARDMLHASTEVKLTDFQSVFEGG